jgi:Lon protease-like protein
MKYVTANEIKRNGVSVVRKAIAEYGDGEAGISVRGKREFVVLDNETYEHLRECEILAAAAEVREDIKAGRYHTDTEKHLEELNAFLEES